MISDSVKPSQDSNGIADDFSLASYGALLSALTDRGYKDQDFSNAGPTSQDIILRHDLDFDLEAALPIAKIESTLGLRATYFVLVRSEFYNPFSDTGQKVISSLIDSGHEIGLHLDAFLYGNDLASLEAAADKESGLLESFYGIDVSVLSFHRPLKRLLGYDKTIGGRLHTYQPRFFSDIGYCSDSRGEWHHGYPLDHPAVSAKTALQLLTHPIWWTMPGAAPADKLDQFFDSRARIIDRELEANCESYRPHLNLRKP